MNLKDLTPKLRVILILGLVGMLLGSIVTLTIVDKDTAGIYAFGGLLLTGLGVLAGVGGQLATNTNGNTGKMLEMLADTQRTNAQLVANSAAMMSLMTPASKEAEAKVIELSAVNVAPLPSPVSPGAPSVPGYDPTSDPTLVNTSAYR